MSRRSCNRFASGGPALADRLVLPFGTGLLLTLGLLAVASAGEVLLKNGVRIEGKPVPVQGLTQALIQQSQGPTNTYPILLIDTPLQRYFVPARQTQEVIRSADLSRFEKFTLSQKKSGRKLMVAALGGFEATPFDEFGRRRITLKTERGPLHIVQGITEITPQTVTVSGLTHMWEHSLATTSLPPNVLNDVLRQATDRADPDDRLAIARFYVQAGLYAPAAAELESIVRDFPELKATAEEVSVELTQLRARQLLAELQRRRRAGQHRLAYVATQIFPVEGMSAAVLREVRQMAAEYEQAQEQADRALSLMGMLQAELGDSGRVAAAGPLRSSIAEELDYETLPRLDAFLRLQSDTSLAADEKLALAFTGWLLGSNEAETDFDLAVRLWHARLLILEYLRTENGNQRGLLLSQIQGLEGIGPDRVRQMLPLLPPPLESPEIVPGQMHRIEVQRVATPAASAAGADEEPPPRPAYHVLLPEGYDSHHAYPLIVALRPAGRPPEDELLWWGMTADKKPGQSQRHGYIVIAPEYVEQDVRVYDYSAAAHAVVLESIDDARRRFHIDSDRIFLSGHGMGGDAAFDIGMSHPHRFAGVIPITGISDTICKWYWPNAEYTAWYVVSGELDRNTLEMNSRELNRMLRHGYDLIYTEYVGRGYESYYEEIHKLFDWMSLHRRRQWPKEFEVKVLRPSDDRFFWLGAAGFPANVTQSTAVVEGGRRQRVAPMPLSAKVTAGNSIYISSGAARHTLWLSPELLNFDERVAVKVNGRQRFNDFLRPSIEAILEDFRLRGDRQQIRSVRLVCD